MDDAVNASLELFDAQVRMRPLMTSTDSADLLDFKRSEVKDLLRHAAFAGCCDETDPELRYTAWKKVSRAHVLFCIS